MTGLFLLMVIVCYTPQSWLPYQIHSAPLKSHLPFTLSCHYVLRILDGNNISRLSPEAFQDLADVETM